MKIAITQGDTNGIGYEIIFKAFEDATMLELFTPIVYGNEKIAAKHHKAISSQTPYRVISNATEASPKHLNILNVSTEDIAVNFGQQEAKAGEQAFLALERAVSDWKGGLVDAIVTAPVCKATIHSEKFPFAGHTEYFESKTEGESLMILYNELMRVALVTTHVPVTQLSQHITAENVSKHARALHNSLKRDFGITAPRIAILGLNPHCGDHGTVGSEDDTILVPTINALNEEGVPCFGPYPADGFFSQGSYRHFDAVLAMYHDQGLAPLKALDIDGGVNFTTGLNLVRTSPDHGTAFDIAGKGEADPAALRKAIYAAIDIVRCREQYDEAHKNILPHIERPQRERGDRPRIEE